MDASLLFVVAFVAHLCKSPFKRRAQVFNENVLVGLGAAVMFLLLSLVSLGATLAGLILAVIKFLD